MVPTTIIFKSNMPMKSKDTQQIDKQVLKKEILKESL